MFGAVDSGGADKGAPKDSKVMLIDVDAPELQARVRTSAAPFVFVNAWATWCQPCIEEFPELVRFAKAHSPPEAELLFVSTDFASEREKAQAFIATSGAPLPTYMKRGGDMEFIDGLSKRWSGALPATFLFAREGTLLELWQGQVTFAQLEEALARHQSSTPPSKKEAP